MEKFVTVCCLLFGIVTGSWAQGLPIAGPAGVSDSGGYVIVGPTEGEVGTGHVYTYTGILPKTTNSVYWRVVGARLINGKRAKQLRDDDLDARQHPELRIEWDSLKTDQGKGLVQLRTRRQKVGPPTAAGQVKGTPPVSVPVTAQLVDNSGDAVATTNVFIKCPPCLPTFGACDPGIYYLGRIGSPSLSTAIREYTYVCSDANILPADPRHRYSASLACDGPIYFDGNNGAAGPMTIIWNISYITESGAVYQESWGATNNPTFGTLNTKYIDVIWYDRVPAYSYSPYYPNGLVALESSTRNALAGQRIVAARLGYAGGNCGTGGFCGFQSKRIDVYYEAPAPARVLAWTGVPDNSVAVYDRQTLPCRTGTYVLQCDDVRDATTYQWTTSAGTISGNGNSRVTLDLSQVPPTTTAVQVAVRTANANAPCTPQKLSIPRQASFTFPITGTPSAISIDGVALSCPGFNRRTLSVPPVAGASTYTWQVTAGDATLYTPGGVPLANSAPTTDNVVQIQFNTPGDVAVNVVANSACGTTSYAANANYQPAGGNTPQPLPSVNPFNDAYSWKYNATVRIPLLAPQPGVQYVFGPVSNVRIFTVWPGATPGTPTQAAGSSLVRVDSGPNGAPYIDLTLNYAAVAEFDLQVQISSTCGGTTNSITQVIHETRPYHGSYLNKAPVVLLDVRPDDPGLIEQAAGIYPNPASEVVHLAPADAGSRYQWARVLDAQGNPVREARAAGNESLRDLSLAGLPAGLYAVQVFDGKRIVTHHLVKE